MLTCSGLNGVGVSEVWARVEAHAAALSEAGELDYLDDGTISAALQARKAL